MRSAVKVTSLLLAGLLLAGPLASAQEDARLARAAEAYANADYPEAAEYYEQILADGKEAFALYYNLGNAYFKSGRLASAILNYERAARINPADPDLLHNLAMARDQTVDKIDMLPAPEFVTTYKSFVNAVPADRWGYFSIAAFVLFLAAAALFLFTATPWVKRLTLTLGLALLLLSGLFFLFGWQQQRWRNARKEAIVFQPSITVQSTPDPSGEALFVLHEGAKVRIVERFRDWARIRIGNGNTGWLPEESVEEI